MRVRLLRRIKELEQIVEEKNREIERLKLLVGTRLVEMGEETEVFGVPKAEEEADPTIWKQMSKITERLAPKGGK